MNLEPSFFVALVAVSLPHGFDERPITGQCQDLKRGLELYVSTPSSKISSAEAQVNDCALDYSTNCPQFSPISRISRSSPIKSKRPLPLHSSNSPSLHHSTTPFPSSHHSTTPTLHFPTPHSKCRSKMVWMASPNSTLGKALVGDECAGHRGGAGWNSTLA